MKRILLVEDEKEISLMVKNYLTKEGYIVDTAFNGEEGLFQFRRKDYSLVILDIMMPKMDGIELIKRIREKSNVPAIILSAKDGEIDKALGLGFGADDYVAKPFSMVELSARVKAAIRRATEYSNEEVKQNKVIKVDDLIIDINNYSVKRGDEDLKLTNKEFEIFKLFLTNPNIVFTKEQIYRQVWEDEFMGDDNIINVHIRRLREKVERDPSKPKHIKTLWGIGYKYERKE
ncbi:MULTISPECIES: response regulator transcription factor [Clostridium]|uniref:response regulator transcription factor n=1 Tax=Clostridium TaxID=1485 RepID=UPI00290153D5|nr:response regulator transcription factor [Clostridium sp.]MDU1310797.1 response regulator transcription factor [Clostridium sp.]MDU1406657.1 response regulator transcription factor [Clostridium sp.]MDU2992704.1 response regulator transcription factor [Clostridium sp.]